jgi:lysophospholipase L1-like esterase
MRLDRFLDIAGPYIVSLTRGAAGRRREFFTIPPPKGRTVFLGDSITEGGVWEDLFPDLPTLNRGIGGDTVNDVQARLDSAIHEPQAVSLLIGTNDLHGPRHLRDLDGIAARTRDLVIGIQAKAPSSTLLLNSVMPRTTLFAERIQRLNDRFQQIAADTDAVYVDLWPALANAAQELREDFTRDHLHLTAAGYRAWVEVLRPHLTDNRG